MRLFFPLADFERGEVHLGGMRQMGQLLSMLGLRPLLSVGIFGDSGIVDERVSGLKQKSCLVSSECQVSPGILPGDFLEDRQWKCASDFKLLNLDQEPLAHEIRRYSTAKGCTCPCSAVVSFPLSERAWSADCHRSVTDRLSALLTQAESLSNSRR
jgi:hypothetical protein